VHERFSLAKIDGTASCARSFGDISISIMRASRSPAPREITDLPVVYSVRQVSQSPQPRDALTAPPKAIHDIRTAMRQASSNRHIRYDTTMHMIAKPAAGRR
jgi:hypothetical protein